MGARTGDAAVGFGIVADLLLGAVVGGSPGKAEASGPAVFGISVFMGFGFGISVCAGISFCALIPDSAGLLLDGLVGEEEEVVDDFVLVEETPGP